LSLPRATNVPNWRPKQRSGNSVISSGLQRLIADSDTVELGKRLDGSTGQGSDLHAGPGQHGSTIA
jgi:hypothetical protein